jgi:hypothetical protein
MQLFKPAVWLGALWIAAAIHGDWHLARHGHDALSFALTWHWLAAVPVFGLLTWFITRKAGPSARIQTLLAIAIGVLLGQVVEPLWEGGGAIRNPERLRAFGVFMGVGVVTWLVTDRLLRRDELTTSGRER